MAAEGERDPGRQRALARCAEWLQRLYIAGGAALALIACGPEQPQGIAPLELCLPADVPEVIAEAIDRAVEALETQAGVEAFELVPGGHCGGAWGTVDVFIRDDNPNGDMVCTLRRSENNAKRCKVWLPRELATEGYCEDVIVLHELGHIVIGGEHVDGTAMATYCDDGRPYFSWRQLDEVRRYFLRGEQVAWLEGGAR